MLIRAGELLNRYFCYICSRIGRDPNVVIGFRHDVKSIVGIVNSQKDYNEL